MHEQITLPNGVRLVSEAMPHVRSAAVGIWVGAGSRFEAREENGAAHFIEHMLFKGTDRYSARELADRMDAVGGQINAYTTRENTCYYARVPDYHLDTAIELLSGMFFESRFDPADVSSERGVVLEEIDMYDDTPEDLVTERMLRRCFPGALGRPILGTEASLKGLDREKLLSFMARQYTPGRLVISLAGSFTPESLGKLRERFAAMAPVKAAPPRKAAYVPGFTLKRKATEQNHLCLGFPGYASGDERRFALHLLSGILGDGMSSRLFQTVREKHGLCYAIGSFTAGFAETGLFGIATALSGETEERALGLILDQVKKLLDEGVTPWELDRTREQIKANLVMSLESTTARMNRLGAGTLHLGGVLSPEAVMERYDAVTPAELLDLAREIFDPARMSFSAVGRVARREDYEKLLTF